MNCGKEYEAKTKRSRFCTEHCSIEYYPESHKNKECVVCGKKFYSNAENNKCCSNDCRNRFGHNQGVKVYWKCIEEEMGISSLAEWLDNEHNNKMRTVLDIANQLNASRITIMRWCKLWGVKTRTISEDNYRRYATMSQEDKNEQTQAAHKEIRILFQNDDWKNNQVRKVLEAQNFNASKPELAIRQALIDHGYGDFVTQYQLGPFFIDIAFPDIKLAVEIDGEYWHSLEVVVKRDKRKNWYIMCKENWWLLRIPATPCINETERMVWEIIQHIETLKQEARYEEAI